MYRRNYTGILLVMAVQALKLKLILLYLVSILNTCNHA